MADKKRYFGDWKTIEDIKGDFFPEKVYNDTWDDVDGPPPPDDFPKDDDIILAAYNTPSYEGTAFVLYRSGGKLFEVNGSHCSCYGLEQQWDPEETTLDALGMRRLLKCEWQDGCSDFYEAYYNLIEEMGGVVTGRITEDDDAF